MDRFDENGWAIGALEPWARDRCYSLFSPGPSGRVDAARWVAQARRFFDVALLVRPDKRYPGGGHPVRDALVLELEGIEVPVITVPGEAAPELLRAAEQAAAHTGGGFDALVRRSRRLWQIEADRAAPRPALLAAAVMASVLLAPVLAPGETTLFGVKGARQRLAELAARDERL